MRNIWAWSFAAVLVVLGIAYIGSPYLAVYNLKQAVKEGDADKIEAGTDITAVRESLKSQLSTAFMHKMTTDPDTKGNPFAAIGALIVPAKIDKAIDTYVTPEGLAALMKGHKPGATQPDQLVKTPEYVSDEEYLGLDRFRVNSHDKQSGEKGPGLLFERQGMVTWKLIKIELPANIFDTPGSAQTSASVPGTNDANGPNAVAAPADTAVIPAAAPDGDDQSATTANMMDYDFSSFPSRSFAGPWVAPDFARAQRPYRQYRTMISEGAKQGPVFAGSVAITQFGCGTDCSMGYAIDLKDGAVVPLPVGGEANSDLATEYHRGSRLLKAAWKGALLSYPGDIKACAGFAYFEWTGHSFKTLKASPHAPTCE